VSLQITFGGSIFIALRHDFEQQAKIIFRRGTVAFDVTTDHTAMHQDTLTAFLFRAYRLHQAATVRCTITGVHIDVFAPQTGGAVIGIAVPHHGLPAVFAGEVFGSTLKFSAHS
jgi:hypothetical protein